MRKVLLLLDHAPNYRESFLRELGSLCDLIVVAQNCELDNLTAPKERLGYGYIELKNKKASKIRWNFELSQIIKGTAPDLVCIALNLRHPIRILDFYKAKFKNIKWIWWGQVYGRNDSAIIVALKKNLIKQSQGCLVYTKDIVERLNLPNVASFDNSQFSRKDYIKLPNTFEENKIKCLFVGRPQERKRLEILIKMAEIYDFLSIRLVGPNMQEYFNNEMLLDNVFLYGAASGEELKEHFLWSNLVVNPGHAGLLVMNAACHNRPIVIDSKVNHAPEVILAKETNQYFIDFENEKEVSAFLNSVKNNKEDLLEKATLLFTYARQEYTVENMAYKHFQYFKKVLEK